MIKQMLPDQPGVNVKVITAKYAAMAADLGLPFIEQERIYNSRPAHELGVWARTLGKTEAWHTAVFHAYYALGRNISEPQVLADMAESIGLPGKKALGILDNGTCASTVNRDLELCRQYNIVAAPTYRFPDARRVGAQPYEKLQQFIESNGALRKHAQR